MTLPELPSGAIRAHQADGLLEVTIDRPRAKNALNTAMYRDLVVLVRYAEQHSAVRVLLITGAEGQFTAGNDLKDFLGQASLQEPDNPILSFIRVVLRFPKPLVVAVEGVAYGIGTTLLLHADYVVASPNASFCLPFIKLGLVPEFGASRLLAERVGVARTREWLMLGEPITAERALQAGLVNALDALPLAEAQSKARVLAELPPKALALTKRLLSEPHRGVIESAVDAEVEAFTQCLASPEFKEAATAFFEKRAPRF